MKLFHSNTDGLLRFLALMAPFFLSLQRSPNWKTYSKIPPKKRGRRSDGGSWMTSPRAKASSRNSTP